MAVPRARGSGGGTDQDGARLVGRVEVVVVLVNHRLNTVGYAGSG
jgi:carboxylesterase type B